MKYLYCLLFLLLSFSPLSAAELTIATLLEAAGKQPDIQASQLTIEATAIQLGAYENNQTSAPIPPPIWTRCWKHPCLPSPHPLRMSPVCSR